MWATFCSTLAWRAPSSSTLPARTSPGQLTARWGLVIELLCTRTGEAFVSAALCIMPGSPDAAGLVSEGGSSSALRRLGRARARTGEALLEPVQHRLHRGRELQQVHLGESRWTVPRTQT